MAATSAAPTGGGSSRRSVRLRGLMILAAVGAVAVGIWAATQADSGTAVKPTSPAPADKAPAPAGTMTALDVAEGQAPADADGESVQPSAATPFSEPVKGTSAPSKTTDGTSGLLSSVLKPLVEPIGRLTDKQAVVAESVGGWPACYASDGAALESAVMGTSCTVIILRPPTATYDYKIRHMMVVTALKVVIGNPITLPRLNATNKIERLFEVRDGGFLDLRSVYLIRGSGVHLDDDHLVIHMGSSIRVLPGGQFVGYGVVFRTVPRDLEYTLEELAKGPRQRQRQFGGHVLVIGGFFYCFGCQSLHLNPWGAPVLNVLQVGQDYLVIGGTLTCVGCFSVHFTMFTNSMNLGNLGACLGGSLLFVGGGVVTTALVAGQWVCGGLMFVSGGTLVTVGLTDQGAFVGLVRAGIGMFHTSAGVMVHVGLLENRAWGVGSVFGAGQTYAVPTGIVQMHESEIVTVQISLIQVISGGNTFVGTGELTWVNCVYGNFGLTMSQHGLGMRWCVDLGHVNLIFTETVTVLLVRAQFILGSDCWLGAGQFNKINATRISIQLVNAAFGGYEVWVGPGSGVFVRAHTYQYRLINFRTSPFGWVVAGTNVPEELPGPEKWEPYAGFPIYVDSSNVYKIKPTGLEPGLRWMLGVAPADDGAVAPTATGPSDTSTGFRSSLVAIQCHTESVKSQPPAISLFTSELHRLRRLEAQTQDSRSWNSVTQLSAPALVALWKSVMAQQQQQQQEEEEESKAEQPPESWPEYYYAPAGKSDCFICGNTPAPSDSFVAPPGTRVSTGWLNESDSGRRLSETGTQPPVDPAGFVAPESSCQASEECMNADSLSQAIASAKAASPRLLQLSPVVETIAAMGDGSDAAYSTLLDTTLLWFDLVVYCANRDGKACGVTVAQVEAATADFLAGSANSQGPRTPSFKVAAASADVPKAVHFIVGQDYLDARDAEVPFYSDQCQGFSRFNVFLTTHNETGSEFKLAPSEAERAELLEAIREQVQSEEIRSSLCAVHTASKSRLHLPSLKRPGGLDYYQTQNWRGSSGGSSVPLWPSVKLLSGNDINPVDVVVANGETYHILLDDFAAETEVVIKLMEGLSLDSGSVIQTVTVPPSSPDNRHRRIKVEWAAGELDDATRYHRKFFLLAQQKDAPILMAFTPAFRYLPPGSTRRTRRRTMQWGS